MMTEICHQLDKMIVKMFGYNDLSLTTSDAWLTSLVIVISGLHCIFFSKKILLRISDSPNSVLSFAGVIGVFLFGS